MRDWSWFIAILTYEAQGLLGSQSINWYSSRASYVNTYKLWGGGTHKNLLIKTMLTTEELLSVLTSHRSNLYSVRLKQSASPSNHFTVVGVKRITITCIFVYNTISWCPETISWENSDYTDSFTHKINKTGLVIFTNQ